MASPSGNFNESHAYIFECKSLQAYVFEKDGRNRLRPSKELIESENQLLNYTDECLQSGTWQKLYSVTNVDRIYPGGIIIGCERTVPPSDQIENYKIALNIREKYFYSMGSHQMRVFTWDRILNFIHMYESVVGF